jgi:hypothetical protein
MSFLIDKSIYNKQGNLNLSNPRYTETEFMIMRNGIRFYTSNTFHIPYPITYKYFSYYKLLYWSGAHILESIEAGLIVRDDIAFIVKYHKDLTRGKILNEKDKQYVLSFREPEPKWSIDPIVIISVADGRNR